MKKGKVVFAIHGGAGSFNVPPEKEQEYRDTMRMAIRAGKERLDKNDSAAVAVEAAIRILEDSVLFNAGKGAVFTNDATHELDASIMYGENLQAGSVTGVKHIKNPITLAHKVIKNSPHVMLAGEGAEKFGIEQGMEPVTQDYFYSNRRWQSLMESKNRLDETDEFGTVGAIALDKNENLAAGTSTGGLTNKAVGRIGDSPTIGAGTYANNEGVAVSATGKGEVFMRGTAASDINALVQYQNWSIENAATEVVERKLPVLGGTGGVIALNRQGHFAAPHSSQNLLYGYVTEEDEIVIDLFPEKVT
ncbi:isoaspartyl peptidase/L-asparaginase [Lentibacillus sp.]|uniref:isoaspartyl peptidase/L-asparaginase family protein n=1 Tax=Lentibacillus sp. TaxID=1925746 RepID=UPI002B4AD9A6|nr:isoaspartyl peptidase/L-asparaginase [Lentibacillus sp.]HLS08457.1 isoaspartyl peptidase/L-asparaginase [Lentibacillus sp.]